MTKIKKEDILSVLEEGRENATTSTEIADRLGVEDSNGNPISRFGLRDLLEAGVPVLACNSGYYIASDDEEVEDYIEKLDQRIEGIEERKQLVRDAWRT